MDSSDANAHPNQGATDSSACPPNGDRAGIVESPQLVWETLAPLLAQRPVVRESRNYRDYYGRWSRPLTGRLPGCPAAVPVYTASGDTQVLVVDLDVGTAGVNAVRRDAAAMTRYLRSAGAVFISDQATTGGIHFYVPLTHQVPFHEARVWALALKTRTPTMDPKPNLNVTDGLIRPPGSKHRLRGHQMLRGMSLAAAHRVAMTGNPPAVWDALKGALSAEMSAVDAYSPTTDLDEAAYVPRRGGPTEPDPRYQEIARTGLWEESRYGTGSEARQAVMTSAVWSGLTLPQVMARMRNGTWPGLAALYARHGSPAARAKAQLFDWTKAVGLVAKAQGRQGREKSVRKAPTSVHSSQPAPLIRKGARSAASADRAQKGTPAEYQFLREWWSARAYLEQTRYTGRSALSVRMVLRALGEAAMKNGGRYIQFGTRSLEIATGLDHTVVAKHLRMLRDEPDPLISLIENDRGLLADLYELRIPDEIQTRAAARAWRPGKMHALRPAFRELGLPAAYVFEALEMARGALRSFDIAEETGIGRSTVYTALETLAAFNLAVKIRGRWQLVATTSLADLAEALGCADTIRRCVTRHRAERQQYRQALRIVTVTEAHQDGITPDGCDWLAEPPPDDDESVWDMLGRVLGAYPAGG